MVIQFRANQVLLADEDHAHLQMTGGEDRTFDFRLGVAVGAHGVDHNGRLHLSWNSGPTREVSQSLIAA
jgi:hypothetical protein